ncbi:hypothetical protein FOMPIDRAFT_1031055 [Fomitopsis schrenkii]|uniref:Endonuclease/exonuclease/phosphatase domain-containing protein n=1 Tax=Fomitopsis schrenkii TaxID=2126942 RepID=S8FLH1_FOMSC|nr:hypothetical protein FOMPIDRAFT_1031055 [Fomitopsis schrenkii]
MRDRKATDPTRLNTMGGVNNWVLIDLPRAEEAETPMYRASLLLGSLNISGRGNLRSATSKWGSINQLLREQRIGVLMVQETHLTEEDAALIQELYGRRIHIINSPDPTSPLTARGVAFVLNRELVDTSELKVTEVVKGRAIMMKMKWHAGSAITLLNVYAPNQPAENGAFWTRLELDITRGRLAKPDVIAGDFNLVEEAVDRLPMKSSPDAPLLALKSLTRSTNMNDGWRLTNPAAKEYSFPQRGGPARSRIDRVYVTDDLFARSLVWNISTTGVPTDHCLITARVTAAQAPYIGRGRWTMPTHLLSDQVFIKLVATLGEAKLRDAVACSKRETRSPANNPQLVLKRFKDEARALARRRLKTKIPKLRAEIRVRTSPPPWNTRRRNCRWKAPTHSGRM